MIGLTSKIDVKGLSKMLTSFPRHASFAIRQTAFSVEFDAKQNAPVDTGALRASIYISTKDESGYGPSIAEAIGVSISATASIATEFPQPTDPLHAVVAVGMSYGPYLEFGTRFMPAQPFLGPAAIANRQFFGEMMREAWQKAAKDGGAI
jgi:HK97 gp10 family phage protein